MEDLKDRGFYCRRYLTEKSELLLNKFLKKLGVDKYLSLNNYPFHCTTMFSKTSPKELKLDLGNVGGFVKRFIILGNSLVLLLESDKLQEEFDKWLSLGCNYSFSSYFPHITIIENISFVEKNTLVRLLNSRLKGKIFLGKEVSGFLVDKSPEISNTFLLKLKKVVKEKFSPSIVNIQLSKIGSNIIEINQILTKVQDLSSLSALNSLLSYLISLCKRKRLILATDSSNILIDIEVERVLLQHGFLKNEGTFKIYLNSDYYKPFN